MCSNGGKSCSCCDRKNEVRTCICFPYIDRYMITAQIVSILAFLISWFWWVTFFVGFICLVLLQVIWCCRQNKIGLYISAGISFVAAVTSTIAGIYMIVVWKDKVFCEIWYLTVEDDVYCSGPSCYDSYDYCEEGIMVAVAFVAAILWFATSGCILCFVQSGRHTQWEEKLQAADTGIPNTVTRTPTTTAIEMGTAQPLHPADNDEHRHHQQSTTIDVATTSPIAATSYVLPVIIEDDDKKKSKKHSKKKKKKHKGIKVDNSSAVDNDENDDNAAQIINDINDTVETKPPSSKKKKKRKKKKKTTIISDIPDKIDDK